MGLKKKLSSDVLVTVLIRLGTRLQGLIFIPLISKPLGLDVYGAYVQIIAVTGLLAIVCELGLHMPLIRYGQEETQDIADLYYSLTTVTILVGLVTAVGLAAFARPITNLLLGSAQYAGALVIGSALTPLKVFSGMSRNYFRVEMRTKAYSTIEGIRSYISIGVVAAVIIVFDLGLEGVLSVLVATEFLVAGSVQFLVGQKIGYTVPSFNQLIRCLRYSVPLLGSHISSEVSTRGDQLLIGFFLGASAVGVYSISYSIAYFISIYSSSIYTSLFPEISRLIEEGKREVCGGVVRTGVRYYIIIAVPSAVGIYLVGPTVVRLISTVEAAAPSDVLLPFITAGVTLLGVKRIYKLIPTAEEKTVVISKIEAVAAIVNILLNLVLIPWYGIVGAAFATLCSYGVSFVLIYRQSNANIDTPFPRITVVKTTVASAVMFLILFQLLNRQLLPSIVVGPIVYFVVLTSIGGVGVSEIRDLV